MYRRRDNLHRKRPSRFPRQNQARAFGVLFIGFYACAIVLWWCLSTTSGPFWSTLSSFESRLSPRSSTRSPEMGSKYPLVALMINSDHFPYPHVATNESLLHSSAPIVVQLRGEMGNHLSTMAHGIGLQLAALQDNNLSTHLLMRHQTLPDGDGNVMDNPKWLPTSRVLKQCFPAMKDWDFSLGSQWTDFDRFWERQTKQQERESANRYSEESTLLQQISLVNGRIMNGRKGLDDMKEPVTAQDMQKGLAAFAKLHKSKKEAYRSSLFLNVPFLYSDSMDNMVLLKRFLPVFRHVFQVDPSCCGSQLPDPDEAVFVSARDAWKRRTCLSTYVASY